MAERLKHYGFSLVTDGTDNHLLLVDLKNKNLSGSKVEYLCEKVDMSLNKNSVFGDTSAINPGGIRIGTCALTTRNMKEEEFNKIGDFLNRVVELCVSIQEESGKKLVEFKKVAETNSSFVEQIEKLKSEVNNFASEYEFYDFNDE